ncbi:hypothetical protein DICPUDRAFT_74102 [Dictyostelium purpureum]|uniref:TM2 domain-containing protein n=1 Tax=Dictyostelium purpureum TaxID=5786 RepID=F0Z6M6_DICPU|nr:uncharacterized protein DICPUDRAFT_74102 [Dictyostelium purpureum]EGC40338.1 hypothetical protein DICPUDRAFT_74102 [Dictyostelium purpureum]|eukprot:XP_003283089.1 hypothetical protein DICPUDRAFT_74102 [Dictyostelium purpureum]
MARRSRGRARSHRSGRSKARCSKSSTGRKCKSTSSFGSKRTKSFGTGRSILGRRRTQKRSGAKSGDFPKPQYRKEKSLVKAYIIWFFTGIFGFHRLYLEDYEFFFIFLISAGIFGVGFIVDLFYLPTLVRRYNENVKKQKDIISQNLETANTQQQQQAEVEIMSLEIALQNKQLEATTTTTTTTNYIPPIGPPLLYKEYPPPTQPPTDNNRLEIIPIDCSGDNHHPDYTYQNNANNIEMDSFVPNTKNYND